MADRTLLVVEDDPAVRKLVKDMRAEHLSKPFSLEALMSPVGRMSGRG